MLKGQSICDVISLFWNHFLLSLLLSFLVFVLCLILYDTNFLIILVIIFHIPFFFVVISFFSWTLDAPWLNPVHTMFLQGSYMSLSWWGQSSCKLVNRYMFRCFRLKAIRNFALSKKKSLFYPINDVLLVILQITNEQYVITIFRYFNWNIFTINAR